jgi:hypothetical protein
MAEGTLDGADDDLRRDEGEGDRVVLGGAYVDGRVFDEDGVDGGDMTAAVDEDDGNRIVDYSTDDEYGVNEWDGDDGFDSTFVNGVLRTEDDLRIHASSDEAEMMSELLTIAVRWRTKLDGIDRSSSFSEKLQLVRLKSEILILAIEQGVDPGVPEWDKFVSDVDSALGLDRIFGGDEEAGKE